MNVAIMCSGGDCAGMNPAIKTFVEYAFHHDLKPYLIYDGLEGLIDGEIKEASHKDVGGIMHLGGTIIRTSRSKRFFDKNYRQQAFEHLQKRDIDRIIVLGGDGSFRALDIFAKEFDLGFVGIPSTIDNDICGTEYCLGVDTSLNVIRKALDDIRDTSSSFKRAFVVETMGRNCGYLALISSLTSGAEVCIIPEVKPNLETIKERLTREIKEGRSYILSIVAEGCEVTDSMVEFFEEEVNIESRKMVLGHIQRGGNPTVYDRLMAYEFVTFAMNTLVSNPKMNAVIVYQDAQFKFLDIHDIQECPYQIKPELLKLVKPLSN